MEVKSWLSLHAELLLSQSLESPSENQPPQANALLHWVYGPQEILQSWRRTSNAALAIYNRVSNIRMELMRPQTHPNYHSPILVSKEFQRHTLDTTSQSLSLLSFCFNFIAEDKRYRNPWIEWREPDSEIDYDSFIPQLYRRHGATALQRNSLIRLLSFQITSAQLASEIGVQRFIETLLSMVLGGDRVLWCHSSTGYNPMNSEDTPLCVLCQEASANDTDGQTDNPKTVRPQVACALHPTMLLFLASHYLSHAWSADRVLNADDVVTSLDERLFAFSICYNTRELSFYANFPVIAKQETGQYIWRMRSQFIQSYDLRALPGITERLVIFNAILAVEQHLSVLKRVFPYLA